MKRIIRIISIIAAIAVVAFTGIFFLQKQPDYNNFKEIQLFNVRKDDLDNSIYIVASVVSEESDVVCSEVNAPVAEIRVKEGDIVRKGDVICTFNCNELQKEYDNYITILEQLNEVDDMYASFFTENADINKRLIELQKFQADKTIESYQKKYNDAVALTEDYRVIYEQTVAEVERLKALIKNNEEEVTIEESTVEKSTDENIDGSDSKESVSNNIYAEQYSLAVRKKDDAYSRYLEMKKNAADIYDALNSYSDEQNYLFFMSDDNSDVEEKYFTPESRASIISDYTEKAEMIRAMLDNSVVTATRDGIITELYISNNEYVFDNRICSIQDPENVHFRGYLVPNSVSDISLDKRILVCMPESEFVEKEGEILFISDNYDHQMNGYAIDFTIEDLEDSGLYLGYEVSAKIILESKNDVLIVPYDAIFEKDGEKYVRKHSEAGGTEDVPVRIVLNSSYYVAIESNELFENDLVETNMLN